MATIRERLCRRRRPDASAGSKTRSLQTEKTRVIEQAVSRWRAALPGLDEDARRSVILRLLFLRLAECHGLEPPGQLRASRGAAPTTHAYGVSLLSPSITEASDERSLDHFIDDLYATSLSGWTAVDLGRVHERLLESSASRKAGGIYYTPEPIVDAVVRSTLGRHLAKKTPTQIRGLTLLDPACGSGAFLLGAFDYLAAWYRRHTHVSPEVLPGQILRHLHGVDRDPLAVEVTRLALILKAAEQGATLPPDLAGSIQCGDALLGPDCHGFDWAAAFPAILENGGFSLVIGNPPWGQKGVHSDPTIKRYLAERFPSSAGIHDLFRPFVEQGVLLTAPGGRFGMVLPDIILLKNYPQTRRFLLEQLTLERIEWWGRAFADAHIDVATVVGLKEPAPTGHRAAVRVHDQPPLAHAIPQADFLANPRYSFNLHLSSARRDVLDRLADCPRLGDYFEVHEGVHSGNMRAELFVSAAVDASCRPLLFGRDEIAPYQLHWRGRYLRLAALPDRKTRERYANLGQPHWHERSKLLVRRTGDFVLAAVDDEGRYASNNFFLVFPRRPCSLSLDGLGALLNSRFMTWYFRAIEPRRGRAFAELKIKHLTVFPLPHHVRDPDGCRQLNEWGQRRRGETTGDDAIDELVRTLFGVAQIALT